MWVLVQDGTIVKTFEFAKGFTHNNNQYSKDIFTKWSSSEKEAIGLYEVVIDNTNLKDSKYYNNGNPSITFSNNVATKSWPDATAKDLNDVLVTQEDIDNGLVIDKEVGDVKIEGLKTIHKRTIKEQASNLLAKNDWQVIKATEVTDYSVPSAVTAYRANVRTRSNEMETAIDNAADVDALEALYTYTEQADGTSTRPLGGWPEEVI